MAAVFTRLRASALAHKSLFAGQARLASTRPSAAGSAATNLNGSGPVYSVMAGAGLGLGAFYYAYFNGFLPEHSVAKGRLGLSPLAKDVSVVFVLGGPGAGKGTQCARIVEEFGFVHLSAGDLLRAERQRAGSPYGELINNYIKEGQIVPMEITIALLHQAMKESGSKRFLIDGFPRALDQAQCFEDEVCKSQFTLYFDCPDEEMLRRLLKRGESSGRVDDNIESIKKRFVTFHETSYPVVEYYSKMNKVKTVSCLNPVDKVYEQTRSHFLHL
ncbi:adenylate kinase-domain-containing protein [Polychytrium aggregatum]|uniref:adenylate kinase-domain-containing protein n=1 Tax=Polychytrium aggregatum TaxID=110093 RepID=UPI0022FE1774|nr:adenylate kinase-domain-containing protein [Polychytrium aggregatum]KAI9199869.1 adenylate kinase-domain-containing protein [Polychytrium aggregatum]